MANRIINGIPFDANAIIDQEGEVSYDYVLFAEDIAQWLGTYFGNGILVPKAALMTTQFQVSKVSETQVSINKGNIVINGRTGFLKNSYNMDINYAQTGKQRIDRIVIELNTNETVNEFRPLVLKGVESEQNPQIPDITRDEYLGIYQMSLANILVTADGVQTITDERNDSNLCGVSQVLIGVKPAVPVTGDSALNISYDNSYTGAEEQTVQGALDNLYNTKKKIILDGVDQQELKLSTKYQFATGEDIYFSNLNVANSVIRYFVIYKNEVHVFVNNSSNNHFKVVNGVVVADVDCPIKPNYSDPINWVCSDNDYIYAICNKNNTINIQRFNGTTWENFFTIPSKTSSKETILSIGAPSIHSGKLYVTVYTSYGTSSTAKCYYAGYVNLETKEWVELPTLPSTSHYGYCSFAEINGSLYVHGNNDTSDQGCYKLNSGNSWTKIFALPLSKLYKKCYCLITVNNKAYIIAGDAVFCFDGSNLERLVYIPAIAYPSLIFTDKFHIYGSLYANADGSTGFYNYCWHYTIEKVLCLED